jgi:hypothetical protein
MLKHLRNKSTQKKIYIGLALLIIPSFFLSGLFINQGEKAAGAPLGLIDGHKVSLQSYLSSYRAVTHQAQFVYGDRFDEMKRYLNFKGEAWDRLLLMRYAENEKIKISDSEVVKWITSQKLFNQNGKFDDAYYKNYVARYLQLRERDFEEEIRQMLALAKIRERVKASAPVAEEELRRVYDRRFGEKSLVYGFLPWEAMKDKVKVEDAQIEQIYPLVKDRLTEPEKLKFRFIAVPKKQAEAVKASAAGQKIDALAKNAGLTIQETPFFSKSDPVPAGFPAALELLAAAFSLAPGEESAWIDLEDASYKVEAAGKTEGRTLSLEEAKDSIRQLLIRQDASKEGRERLKALKPRLEKEDFEKVLKEEKIDVRSLERYKAGDALSAFGESEQIERAIADLKEGSVSEPFEGPAGAAIAKVIKETPADLKAYEEGKIKFSEAYADEKADEKMKGLLENLRKNLKIDTEMLQKIFGSAEEARTPAPAAR